MESFEGRSTYFRGDGDGDVDGEGDGDDNGDGDGDDDGDDNDVIRSGRSGGGGVVVEW